MSNITFYVNRAYVETKDNISGLVRGNNYALSSCRLHTLGIVNVG